MKKYTIKDLEEKNLIIFSAIMGSHAYGTAMPTSDIDIRGVYIQPAEDILGFGYVEQVADDTNDTVFYEVKRFLELVQTNNPNILELLNCPEDCVQHKDPLFDLIIDQKETFITKQCKMSFAGYAINQIKKARGYNKKINWEEHKMVRKNVLDFCNCFNSKLAYGVFNAGGSFSLHEFLIAFNENKIGKADQRDFGLAKVDKSRDTYALYYVPLLRNEHSGIVNNVEKANDVQLTSIPKDTPVECFLYFNKDAYTSHCKKYKEYKEWLNNRNEDRFKMNKEHGKNYDSKNLSHCIRLLDMAIDVAKKKEIVVRRSEEDIKLLMSIRRGEMEYDDILSMADQKIKEMDELFENSDLPENVDNQFVDNLLITIRQLRYYGEADI
jgi:uncharacterized protein